MQGSPTTAHTYKICMVYDHAYSMPPVQRNSTPTCSNKIFQPNTDCTKVVGVEYYIQYMLYIYIFFFYFFILVIRRVPNHSSWTACFGLFKLSTCSSLLIGRGHSTWFGAQILTRIHVQLHLYFNSFDVIKHM